MVIASVASTIYSKKFNWQPDVVRGDDPREFVPNYVVKQETEASIKFFRSKFADLPSAGIWEDRSESDEDLLEELGSGWRGFAAEA